MTYRPKPSKAKRDLTPLEKSKLRKLKKGRHTAWMADSKIN